MGEVEDIVQERAMSQILMRETPEMSRMVNGDSALKRNKGKPSGGSVTKLPGTGRKANI